MILKQVGTMTERIVRLIKIHDCGLIDAATYTKELRALQDEFLSPEVIGPETLEEVSGIVACSRMLGVAADRVGTVEL